MKRSDTALRFPSLCADISQQRPLLSFAYKGMRCFGGQRWDFAVFGSQESNDPG